MILFLIAGLPIVWFYRQYQNFGVTGKMMRFFDRCDGCQEDAAPLYECGYVDLEGFPIASFTVQWKYLCDNCKAKLIEQKRQLIYEFQESLLSDYPQYTAKDWGKADRYECKKLLPQSQ